MIEINKMARMSLEQLIYIVKKVNKENQQLKQKIKRDEKRVRLLNRFHHDIHILNSKSQSEIQES